MPGGDGTGPMGRGPMSGRGLGYCAGFRMPGSRRGPGRAAGWWPGGVSERTVVDPRFDEICRRLDELEKVRDKS